MYVPHALVSWLGFCLSTFLSSKKFLEQHGCLGEVGKCNVSESSLSKLGGLGGFHRCRCAAPRCFCVSRVLGRYLASCKGCPWHAGMKKNCGNGELTGHHVRRMLQKSTCLNFSVDEIG